MTEKNPSIWKKIDDKFKYLAPLFLVLVLVYLYDSLVNSFLPSRFKKGLLLFIIGYFVFELIVKYMVCGNYKRFLKEYWLEIILVIPFFKSVKILGVAGKGLKLLKYLPYGQKLAKIPMLVKKTLGLENDDE